MRKLLLLGLLIANCQLLTVNSFAQAPKLMNYQGVARSADGQTLVNKQINLRLSILSAVDITQAIYKEEQSVTTTEFGLFALKIGEGTPIKGNMADVDWGSADHFIAVELDAENNGHFQFMGTSQLLSVPYAFYAEKSGTAKDLENMNNLRTIDFSGTFGQTIRSNGSDWEASSLIYNSGSKIGIGNTSPSEVLDVTGNVNVDGDLNLTRQNEITFDSRRALAMDENRNLMQGFQTGNSLTTGANNNLIGHQAGKSTTTGTNNSIIGYQAGLNNTTGDANIFYGYKSGYSNTTGSNNYFIGLQAGYNSTTGVNNVAMGTKAGYSLGDGKDNTFVGREAGYSNTGNRNSFIGKDAGRNNTTGFDNTYIGYNAYGVDTLENATAIGANTTVETSNSVVLGNAANVGVGTSAPSDKLHVVGNARIDAGRIEFVNTSNSIYLGAGAGVNDDFSGFHQNIGIGYQAVHNTTSGRDNVAMGYQALYNSTTGRQNTAIGYRSLYSTTTGMDNIGVGYFTLNANTTGNGNIAMGLSTMQYNTTGEGNTIVGYYAGVNNMTGENNTGLGRNALYENETGNYNTAIGMNADVLSEDLMNATAIGANAKVGCDSCLVLGDASNVGIGTTTPAYKLDIPSSTSNEVVAHIGQASIANKGTLNFHILNDNLTGYNVGFGQNSGGLTTIGSHNHDIEFYTDSAATKEVMRIYNDGRAYVNYNFGFGTNNPGLQVSIGTSGTGIENDGSNNLQIYNSGAENARFTSTGNLGIGTTNPKAALHVTEIATGFSWSPFSQTSAILERTGGSLLSIVSNNGGISSVVMGDADSQFSGRVRYEHTDDRMEFWTSNTEKVSILSNGNVGIGSNTPAEKLDVAGSIRMVDGNQQVGYLPVSDANGTMTWTTPTSVKFPTLTDADGNTKIQVEESTDEDIIRFDIDGTEYFSFKEGGLIGVHNTANNIGFGEASLKDITTGTENLAIGGYSLAVDSSGSQNVAVGSGAASLLRSGSRNSFLGHQAGYYTSTGNNNVCIGWQSGYTVAFGDGNVFIGSKSGPSSSSPVNNTLYIDNQASNQPLIYGEFDNDLLAVNGAFRVNDGNQAAGYIPVSDANGTMTWTDPTTVTTANDGDWTISGNDQFSAVSGNVGIGTTSPNEKLDVNGNIRLNNNDIYLRAGTDSNHGIGWYGTGKLWASSAIDGPVVYGYSGGVLGTTNGGQKSVLYWNKDGEVGIGTTNPSSELDVKGKTTTDSLKVGSGGTVMKEIIIRSVAYDLTGMPSNSNKFVQFSVPGAEVGDLVFVSPDGKLDESVVIAACWVDSTDVVEVKFRNTEDQDFGNGEIPERNYRFLVIKQ